MLRVAIRAEGEYVNAYVAERDTMEGAELLMSIRRSLCARFPQTFDAFKANASAALQLMLESRGIHVVAMVDEPAPEHERTGSA